MRNDKDFDQSVINCQKCVNWNFLSDSDLLNYEAPKHYPANSKENTINLRPMEITFELLNNCINVANDNLKSGC